MDVDQGGCRWDPETGVILGREAQGQGGQAAQCGEGEESRARMDISEGALYLPKVPGDHKMRQQQAVTSQWLRVGVAVPGLCRCRIRQASNDASGNPVDSTQKKVGPQTACI